LAPVPLRLAAVAGASLALAAPALAAPPQVTARAYLVQNAATGDVVAQRNADARLPIASITKLMTVYVTLRHARPDEVVTVARQAAAVGESTIHLRAGERITVRDLIAAALIQSANDAADALADYVASGDTSRFVRLMNFEAQRLGLDETHFSRPDGLDAPQHYSSARDVTLLARILMHDPLVRQLVAERTATIAGGRRLHTWNDLLGAFPGLVGVKTGHTGGAGWCEVAAVRRPGYTLYVTLLGSPTRAQRNADLAALMRWGVSRFRLERLVRAGRVYAHAQAGWGRRPLALVPARAVARVVRLDRPLLERVTAAAAVSLPVRRGTPLGSIRVLSAGRVVATVPLVAARSIDRPGLAGRLGWIARRTGHHLLGFVR
jgi:D-alanyl-D-alanine carboxypeptidase (penicillin-binding protein 5/6)